MLDVPCHTVTFCFNVFHVSHLFLFYEIINMILLRNSSGSRWSWGSLYPLFRRSSHTMFRAQNCKMKGQLDLKWLRTSGQWQKSIKLGVESFQELGPAKSRALWLHRLHIYETRPASERQFCLHSSFKLVWALLANDGLKTAKISGFRAQET